MQYEIIFDNTDGIKNLEEKIMLDRGSTRMFYQPRDQYDHPHGNRRILEKEAEETTQEAVREAEEIHKKYHS